MKKAVVVLMAFLFFVAPNIALAQENYVIVEGERRIFLRLEFSAGGTELTPASEAAFNEATPSLSDGTMRRYEVHGNYCSGVSGSRRNAFAQTEAVLHRLQDGGVPENDMTSILNVAQPDGQGACPAERRVDVMATDLRRETVRPVVEGRRTVAVYMAGEEPQAVRGVHNILGGELSKAISANANFQAVDRTKFILDALEEEHYYQRSGMVDDDEIKNLGKQLGVQYMCIANIISVGTGYYIDTRLVDVETAENVRSVTATSSLRDINEYMRVARDIARELVEPDRSHRCGHGEDSRYDPVYQFCFGGRAYNFCAGSGYNPQTQGCLANKEIGTLCADGSIVALGTHCGEHELSVAIAPPVGGTVVRAPDAKTYGADVTVALSAVANRGFQFAGWAGAQTSTENFISVTMTRNMPVIAMFRSENNNALIATAFPNEGGTISRTPEHDDYASNEVVKVTAIPNRGFEFVRWEGAASDSSATINVLMNEGKALVAIFRPNLHTLNATAMPEFGGSVFINGTALAEATTSDVGNTVEVLAQPARGYVFTGWAGDASGNNNPLTIDLTNANVNVIANFAPTVIAEEESESRIVAIGGSGAAIAQIAGAAQVGAQDEMGELMERGRQAVAEQETQAAQQRNIRPGEVIYHQTTPSGKRRRYAVDK